MKQIHILISGKVHGVYFRAFVKEHAIKLGIKGWVMNTDNGVEVLAQGDKEKLNKLVKECKKGPSEANVQDIEIKESKIEEKFDTFKIAY